MLYFLLYLLSSILFGLAGALVFLYYLFANPNPTQPVIKYEPRRKPAPGKVESCEWLNSLINTMFSAWLQCNMEQQVSLQTAINKTVEAILKDQEPQMRLQVQDLYTGSALPQFGAIDVKRQANRMTIELDVSYSGDFHGSVNAEVPLAWKGRTFATLPVEAELSGIKWFSRIKVVWTSTRLLGNGGVQPTLSTASFPSIPNATSLNDSINSTATAPVGTATSSAEEREEPKGKRKEKEKGKEPENEVEPATSSSNTKSQETTQTTSSAASSSTSSIPPDPPATQSQTDSSANQTKQANTGANTAVAVVSQDDKEDTLQISFIGEPNFCMSLGSTIGATYKLVNNAKIASLVKFQLQRALKGFVEPKTITVPFSPDFLKEKPLQPTSSTSSSGTVLSSTSSSSSTGNDAG